MNEKTSSNSVHKERFSGIDNFFHFDADNVGDQMAGPANYFPELCAQKRNFSDSRHPAKRVIMGGGLIFNQMAKLSKSKALSHRDCSLIAWGAGIPPRGKKDREVNEIAEKFSLFGTRNADWSDVYDFVPCASCLSSVFDRIQDPVHSVVIFAHQKMTPNLKVPTGIPVMTNIAHPIDDVIEFLASGETIVTSSYHGVYWAQLLGRKVLCVPFGPKFKTFEHVPFYSTENDWPHELDGATQTAPLLEKYRSLNQTFFRKVSSIWNLETDGK